MRTLIEEAIFRACISFVWAMTILLLWEVWPTDGSPAPEVSYNHFQMK